MKRKILGTTKFVIYFYNGRNIRGNHTSKLGHFVYKGAGRIEEIDENGRAISNYPFTEIGDMISYINKIMSRNINRNLGGNNERRRSKK